MSITRGDITVYFGPKEQDGPDSLLDAIVDFIDSAKRRQKLMIAVQEVDNEDIAKAIVRARTRGVTVDVVIEQSYLLNKKIPDDPFVAGGASEVNRRLQDAMLRATVDIKSDFNSNIFHQKFMVLGNSVLTGSTNFTKTGVTKNLNHVVVVHDAQVANAYKAEFREIQRGNFGRHSIDLEEKPREARVSGIRVKPLFAPDHSPEMEIMKQILKAQHRVDFAVFTFAQSSGIDDALIAAHLNGIQVRGVLDSKMSNQKWAAKKPLVDAGVTIDVAGGVGSLGKVHHKLMTIDDQVSIFGSFNYTGPANLTNDENILVVGDMDEPKATIRNKQEAIATAAREEIDRIRADFAV